MSMQHEGIKNLSMQAGIGYEQAQHLYAVLERNDWCILESEGQPIIASTATPGKHLPTVARFDDMPALIAWLQQYEVEA